MLLTGSQLMTNLLRDGIAPKPDSRDAFLKTSGTVMSCKQHGLPLADWRELKPTPPST